MKRENFVKKEITPRGDGNKIWFIVFIHFPLPCKKRDNPERGRKQMIHRCSRRSEKVKKEITPRGDGNFYPYILLVSFRSPVKKEITPRGDGNSSSVNRSMEELCL